MRCRKRSLLSSSVRRRAFTLTELMVSLAILVGMMALVAMIFSTAGKASGQAQSSAVLYRQLGQVTEIIRRDLDAIQTGAEDGHPLGVLGIARVDVPAKEKTADPDGSETLHRADVLMLMTQRKFEPYVYQPSLDDEFTVLEQVIYGHANFGKLDPGGAGWLAGSEKLVESGAIPASQWHLARRVVGSPSDVLSDPASTAGWPLTGPAFAGNDPNLFTDVFSKPFADVIAFVPPGHFKYDSSGLGFYYGEVSGERFRYESAPSAALYLLKDGFWYVADDDGDPLTLSDWRRTDPAGDHWENLSFWPPDGSYFETANTYPYWPEWFYTGGASRVWLDASPPAGMPERLAAYFLPACSEFKVEFTYDDPREIAIDDTTGEPILAPYGSGDAPAPMPVKWQSVPPGQQWVWSGLSVQPSDYTGAGDLRDLTHPYRWPRAVRITIRVYDPAGGLDLPIEQTIIHCFK